MAKKHKLTKKTDHIDGVNGKDLFVASMFEVNGHERATLSNKDVLNGRGGIDTIRAFIAADNLTPKLKNIEKAVFTRHDTDDLVLDLAKAAKLSSIQLKNFDSDVDISHAGKLANFTLTNAINLHEYSISGIDGTKVGTMNLNFIKVGGLGTDVGMKLLNDGAFKQTNITLKDSAIALTDGNGIKKMMIHAVADKGTNHLSVNPLNDVTKSIVIDGNGDLQFDRFNYTTDSFVSKTLESFDASAMTGSLYAQFGGDNLTSVKAGSGSDSLKLYQLGGSANAKAMVNLGAGNDQITIWSYDFDLDGAKHAIDGGGGHDTISISGAMQDVGSIFKNFESLDIDNGTGAYQLAGSGIVGVYVNYTTSAITLNNLANGGLVRLNNSTTAPTVNLAYEPNSVNRALELDLAGGAFGNYNNAFNASALTHLFIQSVVADNTLFLGQLGTATDPTKLAIEGDTLLKLYAGAGARYISEVTINNAAGVDMSNLLNGSQNFVATGATIKGGAGDDKLVGGAGADTIFSGEGDDIIYIGGGGDTIVLGLNSGMDTLIFQPGNSAPYAIVENFGAFDTINVGALVSNVIFKGNLASGVGVFQSGQANAYFDTVEHDLLIDSNKNGFFDGQDILLELNGVNTFAGSSIIF